MNLLKFLLYDLLIYCWHYLSVTYWTYVWHSQRYVIPIVVGRLGFKCEEEDPTTRHQTATVQRHTQRIWSQATTGAVYSTTYLSSKMIFRFDIPRIGNDCSNSILDKIITHSLHGFSGYIKAHFLKAYQEDCTIVDSYVCNN